MSVQTRILLLLLLLITAFVGGMAAVRSYQHRHLRDVIAVRAAQREKSFDRFVAHQGEPLDVLLREVSRWNQTALALLESDRERANEHLSFDQLAIYDANVIWLYKSDRSLLHSANNLYTAGLNNIPATDRQLREALERGEALHCFVPTDQGWIEVRGAPVQPLEGKSASPGFVFVGRLWSQPFLQDIGMLTDTSLTIVSPQKAAAISEGVSTDGIFRFKRPLPGWSGDPDAYLVVRNESAGIPELNRSLETLFVILLGFSAVFLAVMGLLLWLWVTRPLRKITESLNRNDLSHIARLRSHRSEFGRLAALIHHFYQQRDTLMRESRERLHTEDALLRSQDQLRHSQKMDAVGRLAGGVAHDFNNLLTGIIGYSDILQSRLRDQPSLCESAHAICQAGHRAAALTRQLLAFSRKQVLQPRVVDLNALIVELSQLLRRVIGEQMKLSLDLADDAPRVHADPGQLEQVIVNLCVNARDAMPGGGVISLTTRTLQPEANDGDRAWVEFCVADTGCGIDGDTMENIFEPFFTTKPDGKGTGLGLSTVYGIVSQSGGTIAVESEPGHGSLFRIRLPISHATLAATPPDHYLPPSTKTEETILVAEDEEFVRELIVEVLRQQGYRVIPAVDGVDALERLPHSHASIDLLLTDVVMPRMNGFELAKRLTQSRPNLKILFISGYADTVIEDYGINAGVIAFLGKPFSPSELLKSVRTTLDGSPVGSNLSGTPRSLPV